MVGYSNKQQNNDTTNYIEKTAYSLSNVV